MMLRRVLALCLLTVICCAWNFPHAHASLAPQPSWFNGQLQFNKLQSVSTLNMENIPCEMKTVLVQRTQGQVKEEQCMVSTAYGAVNKQANILQPIDSTIAYEVFNQTSGKLAPIPGHPGMLRIAGDGFSYGTSLSMYKGFYDALRLKYLPYTHYELSQQPDMYFRNSANLLRNVSAPDSLGFSEDGRFLIVNDLREGYVKINTYTYETQPFHDSLARINSGGTPLPAYGAVANGSGITAINYNAPNDWGQKYFHIIDTESCQPAAIQGVFGRSDRVCRTRDISSDIQTSIANIKAIHNVRFTSATSLLFDVQLKDNTINTYAVTASGAQFRQVEYLAMGDSFASGQGAGQYRDGTDTTRNRCHQSTVSYPYLFDNIFDSFASVACSGAKLVNIKAYGDDIRNIKQLEGVLPTEEERVTAKYQLTPGVVEQAAFVGDTNPKVVTLSVGGNDIGFANILEKCAKPQQTDNFGTCFATYEDRYELVKKINGRIERLRTTYQDILKNDPERRLYIIGYPQVADETGSCAVNVSLNKQELEAARDLIAYLNSVIKRAADEAGAYYVDVSDALAGHRLCEGRQVAVNGATAKFDQGKFIEFTESYHPNALGHQLLAAKIQEKTRELKAPMPKPNAQVTTSVDLTISDAIPFLRNIPKIGRTIRDVFYDTPEYITPVPIKSVQQLTLPAADYYLKPDTTYTVELHSTPVSLGSFVADSTGALTLSYNMPNVPPGFHTLHIYGKNMFNTDIDIQKTVYVAASQQDFDGDGIPNEQDICVGDQSSEDVDKDGVPDVCDESIGASPAVLSTQDQVMFSDSRVITRAANMAPTARSTVSSSGSNNQSSIESSTLTLADSTVLDDTVKVVGAAKTNTEKEVKDESRKPAVALGVLLTTSCIIVLVFVKKTIAISK